MLITPFIEGFFLGVGLIFAIGAQNAFVLKQGLKKQHLFLTAMTCFLCDSLLITLGVIGIGELIVTLPLLHKTLRWAGSFFLISYGIRAFWNACHPRVLLTDTDKANGQSKTKTLLALLGFTFLNPHTYIDTFLLLGSIGAERDAVEHLPFILGAISASFCWFFGLTYGASALSPFFKNLRAWQILDTLIGIMMVSIGISLIL